MASAFNGTLYCGATSDLPARHKVHRLVWFELVDTMEAAIASEKRIKKWARDWKKNLIEHDNPTWEDLGPSLGLPPLG